MERKILKYLPFASGLLVFLGVLKVTVFYSYFNIPIIPYLSITDILILFLDDLNSVVAVIVIGIIHIFLTEEIVNKIGESIIDSIILKYKKKYIVFFGIITIILSLLIYTNILEIAIWNIYLIIFTCTQFIVFLFIKRTYNNELKHSEATLIARKIVYVICLIIICSMMPLLALKDIRNIQKDKKQVILYLKEDKVISSNKSILYLGKAGNFHFLSNDDKESIIIKDSEITMIKYR